MKKSTIINLICAGAFCTLLFAAFPVAASAGGLKPDSITFYIETGQTAKARSLLLTELRNQRISSAQIYLLGKLYLDEEKPDSALIMFNSIKTGTEDERLLQMAGQSLVGISKGNTADIQLKIIRDLKATKASRNPLVKIEMAMVFALVNEMGTASELIEQSCNLNPSDAVTFDAAGDTYARLSASLKQPDLYGKACGRYEQAIYSNKEYVHARSSLAQAYVNSHNYFEAKTMLRQLLAIDSTWIPALRLMGEVEYALGNYKQASSYYGHFIELVTPEKAQLQKYAYILYFNQEYQKANSLISKLLQDDKSNAVLLRLFAYTSCELKVSVDGLKAMEEFIKMRQTGDTIRLIASDFEYYGRLLSMESHDSLAVIQYEKAIKMDSTKLSLYENIAKSFEKMKQYANAIDAYTRLLTANPQSPSSVWFARGRNCLLLAESPEMTSDTARRSGILNLAVASFSKVVEMSPNSHLGYLWRGRALAALDPETILGLAEPSYQQSISILEAKDTPEKYKTELTEAYRYMGYLNYLKYEKALKEKNAEAAGFRNVSTGYWDKILTIDSGNQIALQAMKALK